MTRNETNQFALDPAQTRVPGLASVIIPSYNKARYIQATLNSLANQTYPHLEIVVVDDASTDDSVGLIRTWSESNSVTVKLLVHKENRGICVTLNDGIAVARGEFIACLGADDRYLPHKIASHVDILRNNAKASFVYGDTRVEDQDGNVLLASFTTAHLQGEFKSGNVFTELLKMNFIAAPTVTMRASALDEVGLYDESLPYEDYDMWIRLSRVGELACTRTIDCVYVDTPGSLSKSLGGQVDLGHLMILSKYRAVEEVDRRELDAMATTYARRAAGFGPPIRYRKRILRLSRASALYGGWSFAFKVVSVELWRNKAVLASRLRMGFAKLMPIRK